MDSGHFCPVPVMATNDARGHQVSQFLATQLLQFLRLPPGLSCVTNLFRTVPPEVRRSFIFHDYAQ